MQGNQRRLQRPGTGLVIGLVKRIGFLVGHGTGAEHCDFTARGVARQVELDAAIDLAGTDGFVHDLFKRQVQRAVAGLTHGWQGAEQYRGGSSQGFEVHRGSLLDD